jgi:eukaryotic-like serine/threonine-protein kinase
LKLLDELCERAGLPEKLCGNLIDNRYKIKRALGRGGFGFVYLAEHEIFGHPIRKVAFKLLKKPKLKPNEVPEIFIDVLAVIRLAQIYPGHADLKHLVYIYDAGICEAWDERGYVVMECIAGDLQKEIRRHPKGLPVDLALDYAKQICRAMALAHKLDQPLVHRDLKPPNVLIDADGAAKVSDFGLAKAVGGVTGLAAGAGDFFCQAPESLGGVCSPASDVYSIGLILHEMLTGTHPFEKLRKRYNPDDPPEKQREQHKREREKPIPDVATLNVELRRRPDLCDVINRCLKYLPSDRYRNAVELLDALAGNTPPPPPPPNGEETLLFLLRQARICEQRRDRETALDFLARLIARADPNRDRVYLGEALFLSGKIKAEKGNLKEAHKDLFRAFNGFKHEEAGELMTKLFPRKK